MRSTWWSGLVLAAIAVPASAAEIVWLQDAEAAWKQTVGEKRPLLLFVTRPNCKHCNQMKTVTFADEQVRTLVNEGFVPLVVDPTTDPELLKELKITAYPTTLIISPEAELLDRFKGYSPPAEFRRRLIRSRERVPAAAALAEPKSSRR